MSKKLGTQVKNARTEAGLTKEGLAKKVKGMTAAEIGRIERGESEPEKETLKLMAKALGVTQKSLLEAASSKKDGSSKSASEKSSSAKKSASKNSSSKSSSSKSSSQKAESKKSSGGSMKLSATEKKLIEAYRDADSSAKKAALKLLKGTASLLEIAGVLLTGKSAADEKKEDSFLGGLLDSIRKESSDGSSGKDLISQLLEGTFKNLKK